jgi:hypothetical protein
VSFKTVIHAKLDVPLKPKLTYSDAGLTPQQLAEVQHERRERKVTDFTSIVCSEWQCKTNYCGIIRFVLEGKFNA